MIWSPVTTETAPGTFDSVTPEPLPVPSPVPVPWAAVAAAPAEPDRVKAAYRLALGRDPRPAEATEAAEFLAAYRSELAAAGNDASESAIWAAFARVLFGSNEFLTVD